MESAHIEGIASALFFAVFPILMLLIGVYLWAVWKLERFMEKEYPDDWQSLGSPNLIAHNSISNNLKFIRFLKRKDYEQFNDRSLTKKAVFCWQLLRITSVGFFLIAVVLIFGFVVPIVTA